MRAGEAMVFVRFSGCNVRCTVETHGFDCDTEFEAGRELSPKRILAELRAACPSCDWVILTGGEPLVRPGLPALVERLAATPGIEEIALTTNAVLLEDFDATYGEGL